MTLLKTNYYPEYSATAAPIYWEPIMGSGERIVGAVAVLGDDGKVSVASALSSSTMRALFNTQGQAAGGMLGWVCQSMHEHLSNLNSLEQWEPPLEGFEIGGVGKYLGDDIEDVVWQVKTMYAAFSHERESDENDESASFKGNDNASVRQRVCNIVKDKGGLRADQILTPNGYLEVQDETGKHWLDIPIHTGKSVGSIVSAWYKTSQSVESHILKAQFNIAAATGKRNLAKGVFISRPTGIPEIQMTKIDNQVDDLAWRLQQADIRVHVRDNELELAEDILDWSGV